MISIALALVWATVKRITMAAIPAVGGSSIMWGIGFSILAISTTGAFVGGWKAHKHWVAVDQVAAITRDLRHADMVIADRDAKLISDEAAIAEMQSELENLRNAPGTPSANLCIAANDPWLRRKSGAAGNGNSVPAPRSARRAGIRQVSGQAAKAPVSWWGQIVN
jgi:hypothetical protein